MTIDELYAIARSFMPARIVLTVDEGAAGRGGEIAGRQGDLCGGAEGLCG